MVQQFLAWAIGKNPLKLEKCIHTYIYIYIYIEREREREREIPLVIIYTKVLYKFLKIYIYMVIQIYEANSFEQIQNFSKIIFKW